MARPNILLQGEIACISVLDFWEPWVLFSVIPAFALSNLIHQRRPSPKTEKDVKLCIFHGTYARNEYVLLFTLR